MGVVVMMRDARGRRSSDVEQMLSQIVLFVGVRINFPPTRSSFTDLDDESIIAPPSSTWRK